MKTHVLIVALGAVGVVVACGRDRPAATMTTSGDVISNEAAVTRLTAAWCEQVESCGEIGNTKRFESQASCKNQMEQTVASAVGAAACPAGLRASRLTDCEQALREASCGSTVSRLQDVPRCQPGSICTAE